MLALLALGTLVAGCGESAEDKAQAAAEEFAAQPAAEIMDQAREATRRAFKDGYRGKMAVVYKGDTLKYDDIVDADGAASTSLATKKSGSNTFMEIGGKYYFRGDLRYWKSQTSDAADAKKWADKWFTLTKPDAEAGGFMGQLNNATDTSCFFETGKDELTVKGLETRDGKRVVVIEKPGKAPGTAPGLTYVAAEGEPLILESTATASANPGRAANDCPKIVKKEAKLVTSTERKYSYSPEPLVKPKGAKPFGQ